MAFFRGQVMDRKGIVGIFKFSEKSCESVAFYEEKHPERIERVFRGK